MNCMITCDEALCFWMPELTIHFYLIHWQAKDFDPDSLRNELPRAVSSLEWAISEGKGKAYVHCTAGLGRAPAVAIAYMFWFCGMNVSPLTILYIASCAASYSYLS